MNFSVSPCGCGPRVGDFFVLIFPDTHPIPPIRPAPTLPEAALVRTMFLICSKISELRFGIKSNLRAAELTILAAPIGGKRVAGMVRSLDFIRNRQVCGDALNNLVGSAGAA